ncbi:cytochrome C assembly family protein [Thermovibrio ammonificans]
MSPEVLIYSTAVLYAISTVHYLLYLIFQKEKLAVVGLYSARVGFLTNLAAVVALVVKAGAISLFTPKGAFLLLGISVVTVFLYFSTKHRLSLSGAFLMPWATVSLIVASLASGTPKVVLPVGTVGMVHIVTAFLGYSAFIFAAVLSVIYLIFERHLKKKKFSVFFHKLPSLNLLESVIYHAITVGFMFITVSMFAGAVWSERLFGTYWSWHPKQVATLISWFVYAGIIHLYLYGNWKGKRLCYLSLAGLSVIMLNFIGVNLLSSKDIHSFKG